MNFYSGIILFIVVILGYILGLKELFKFNFGKSLFYSSMIIMFLMVIFSFLDILVVGRIILIVVGVVSLIYSIINSVRRKENIFKYFNNFSFWIFLIGLIVIIFASSKVKILMGWDECSYWATMVKRLFYSNSYLDTSNFHPMYYPPSLTSYNYFIVKFLGMQDKSIYFSQYFLILSSIIYFIRDVKMKNFIYGLGQLFLILMFLVLILNPYILTLYSEIPLILIAAIACLNIVISSKKIEYLFIFIMIFNFTLIKSNGVVLSFLPLCICLFQLFNIYLKKLKNEKKNFKNLLNKLIDTIKENYCMVIILFSSILAYLCFSIYLSLNNIVNPQSLPTSTLDSLISFAKSFIYRQDVVSSYFVALSSNYSYSNLNVSAIALVVMFVFGYIILKKINLQEKEIERNKYIEIVYIISFAVYALALLYSYCCMFSPFEAQVLASYDRYINTFLGTAGLCFFGSLFYFTNKKDDKNNNKFIIYLSLIMLVVVNINEVFKFAYYVFPYTTSATHETIVNAKQAAEKYYSYFDEDDKIHLIIYGDYGLTTYATIYYMTPLKMYDPRFDGDNWSIRIPESEEAENTVVMSSNDYFEYLDKEDFTHVLVIKSSDEFSKQYSDIFETLNGQIVTGIYEINYDENKLEFRK